MNTKPKKILVVEDQLDLLELYVDLLKEAGYDVDSAVDGEIATEKLKKGGWDLTLLDIVLPKIDGLTVLQLLQQDPPKKINGPIILLTALAQESLIHKGLKTGAAGYLIKSEITPDQVLEEVKGFLESG